MLKHKDIVIKKNEKVFYTKGLLSFIGKELKLDIGNQDDTDYFDILKYIIDYCIDSNSKISSNQNIAYYSWLLQFRSHDQNYYGLYEISSNGEAFNKGCDTAISIIREQSEICSQYGLIPSFPNFNQMIVISEGVYEGKDVEAIRYVSPGHMSGWWLITDDYNDNIESLMTVHFYHVAFKRPDILKYLALPFGYRFLMENDSIEIIKDDAE